MKAPDSQIPTGFSDPEVPTSVVPENGDFMASESAAHQDFRERAAHEQTVASLRLLWESRRFLGRMASAGLLLSTLVAFLTPSRFQSVARLMPPDNQSGSVITAAAAALSGGASGMGGMASELLGLKSTADLLVGILNSRTVEDRLIQKFDLRKVYWDRRIEDARKDLAARTQISVDRKSQIITIGVTDKSPLRAAAMGQAYVEELNRTLAEVSTSSARRERIFLEGRLQAVNQELEAAEKDFSQFASQNTAIDIKEQGRATVDAAAILQGQYFAERSELEGVRQIYTDSNVRVRSAQARVDELQNQLMKVRGKDDNTALTRGDSLYPSIRKLPLLGVPYADLYRKTRVEEAVFETLSKEYELAKVEEAKEIPTVKVLDPPDLPEKKSFPPRLLIMLMGSVLAFAFGVTWVLGRTMWEQTDPADPGVVLAREIFSTVRSAVPWASRNGSGLRPRGETIGERREPAEVHQQAVK
ncbi:MAG TPA: GNVR domain-containing protein [Terriglobia bacterium]|nr:GNVR domain-containing protein [Terriglobia bacterium]